MTRSHDELVGRLYTALRTADADALARLLHHDFTGRLTPGLPWGLGRQPVVGPEAMLRAWRRIGQAYDVVARPDRVITSGDEVVVLGAYRGRARETQSELEAWFVHLWRIHDGRIIDLRQVTDTVAWRAAAREWHDVRDEPGSRTSGRTDEGGETCT